jgi:hypothetical protein
MTDNQTTAYNINRKATARTLVPSTRKFLEMIQKEGLQVKADYIPGGRESDCRFAKPPRNSRRLFPSTKSLLESCETTKTATECRSLCQRIQSPPTDIRISTKELRKSEQFRECPQYKLGEHVSIPSSSNTIDQSSTRQIQDGMSKRTASNPELARPEIR